MIGHHILVAARWKHRRPDDRSCLSAADLLTFEELTQALGQGRAPVLWKDAAFSRNSEELRVFGGPIGAVMSDGSGFWKTILDARAIPCEVVDVELVELGAPVVYVGCRGRGVLRISDLD